MRALAERRWVEETNADDWALVVKSLYEAHGILASGASKATGPYEEEFFSPEDVEWRCPKLPLDVLVRSGWYSIVLSRGCRLTGELGENGEPASVRLEVLDGQWEPWHGSHYADTALLWIVSVLLR